MGAFGELLPMFKKDEAQKMVWREREKKRWQAEEMKMKKKGELLERLLSA